MSEDFLGIFAAIVLFLIFSIATGVFLGFVTKIAAVTFVVLS